VSRRKKALLLGDSIRMSYQPLVAEMLSGRAEVVGPAENCQFSEYTLASSLDGWLAELGRPDVVHWNNGLHDVGHNPERSPVQYPVQTYLANLAAILKKLRQTGAIVIWGTTTPVHPDRPFLDTQWSWRNEDIPVNDLHAIVASSPDLYLAEDMLHLSEEGKKKCAEAVSAAIQGRL